MSNPGDPGPPADAEMKLVMQWQVFSGTLTFEERIYIPVDALLHNQVIRLHHHNPEFGHFRALRTTELISCNF
jgi:hypothetical protein